MIGDDITINLDREIVTPEEDMTIKLNGPIITPLYILIIEINEPIGILKCLRGYYRCSKRFGGGILDYQYDLSSVY